MSTRPTHTPTPTPDAEAEANNDQTPESINDRGALALSMRDAIVAEARQQTISAKGGGHTDPFDIEWAEAVIGQRIVQGKLSAQRRWINVPATVANVEKGIRSIAMRDLTDELWPTVHAALKVAAVNKGLTVGRGPGQVTFTYVAYNDRDGKPKATAALNTLGTYRIVISK